MLTEHSIDLTAKNSYTTSMLGSHKRFFRVIILTFLGFLIGTLGVLGYSGALVWRGTWQSLFSFTKGNEVENPQIASRACLLDQSQAQKSEDEQIFFISCGGIY